MMLGPLTATVLVRGWDGIAVDRHGNRVLSILSTWELPGCHLQPRASAEELDARQTTVSGFDLFTPPLPEGEQVTARDLIRVAAAAAGLPPDPDTTTIDFEIDGEPGTWLGMGGAVHHLEIPLRRVIP